MELKVCQRKIDDLENRSRRNLRFLGFPENSEAADPEALLVNWLHTTMPNATLSNPLVVETAHCLPLQGPPTGATDRR